MLLGLQEVGASYLKRSIAVDLWHNIPTGGEFLRGTPLQSFPIEPFSLLQCFGYFTKAKHRSAVVTHEQVPYFI